MQAGFYRIIAIINAIYRKIVHLRVKKFLVIIIAGDFVINCIDRAIICFFDKMICPTTSFFDSCFAELLVGTLLTIFA